MDSLYKIPYDKKEKSWIKKTIIFGLVTIVCILLGLFLFKLGAEKSNGINLESSSSIYLILISGIFYFGGIILIPICLILFGVLSIKFSNYTEEQKHGVKKQFVYLFWEYLFVIPFFMIIIFTGSDDNWGLGLILLPFFGINLLLNIIALFKTLSNI